MARNQSVKADANAPGVTEMMARFAVNHPLTRLERRG